MLVLVSVIVPVYNVEAYVRLALDSVMAAADNARQYCEVEVVCVDDGSTDSSGVILDEFAREISDSGTAHNLQVKVCHQVNSGVSAARNRALELACGDWVCYLDADDLLDSCIFSACCKAIADCKDVDMVSFGLENFYGSVRDVKNGDALCDNAILDVNQMLPFDVAERGFYQFLYRHDVFDDIRFPSLVMGEDRLFLCKCLVKAGKIVMCDRVLYYYRQREGSAVNGRLTWRKWRDNVEHGVRRMWVLLSCRKRVEFRVYRHQLGLLAMTLVGRH